MERMQPFAGYVLVGPTAVGKTATAQKIAEEEDFDVLSADSMLVYKGMDIGTSKPCPAERRRVRYFGVDLIEPDRTFSVWEYRNYALDVLKKALSNRRRMIVVGGSGLYVRSLTRGLRDVPGENRQVREHWEGIAAAQGAGPLQSALRQKNLALYEALPDKQNARRLIRALETADSWAEAEEDSRGAGIEEVPVAGLELSMPELKSRIASRVERMYRDGLVEETASLLRKHGGFSRTARQAIGYAEAIEVLRGRCSREEAMAGTVRRTARLARRQMTWFRHKCRVGWIVLDGRIGDEDAAAEVLAHWRKHGPTPIPR